MTGSRLWLALSTVASIGTGFVGGMMFAHRAATRDGLVATIGQLYEVDTETYADGGLVDFLAARANSSDLLTAGKWDGWTILRFRAVAVFIKKLHDGHILPGQRGALYTVRAESSAARSDPNVQRFLQQMIDLGLVAYGGRWPQWGEVLRIPDEGSRREATPRQGHVYSVKGMILVDAAALAVLRSRAARVTTDDVGWEAFHLDTGVLYLKPYLDRPLFADQVGPLHLVMTSVTYADEAEQRRRGIEILKMLERLGNFEYALWSSWDDVAKNSNPIEETRR